MLNQWANPGVKDRESFSGYKRIKLEKLNRKKRTMRWNLKG